MKKFLLGSVALAAVIAGPAMAADMPLKAPPPPPVFSWTGCYVGIEGGGAWGRSRHDNTGGGGILFGSFTPRFDISGGLAGVEYGCNQQFGNFWVFGLEGDWSWANKKGSSAETGVAGVILGHQAWTDETRERWISTSRARVGWAWNRAWLYVTGGLAAASIDARVTIPAGPFAGTFTDRKILYGWTVGAGLEYAFWNNWSIKAEYLYVKLENREFFDNPLVVPVGVGGRGGVNVDNNIVRVGLNWRYTDCVFGFPGGCSGP
jgi:outer membrane immunogenic protein